MATEKQIAANRRNAQLSPTERALVDSLIHYAWLLRRYRWLRPKSGAPPSTA